MSGKQAGKPLQHSYCFWYMRRGGRGSTAGASAANESNTDGNHQGADNQDATSTSSNTPNPYENSIKTIANVRTVEEFWRVYDHLVRPNDLPTTTDYHFFRSGIKPTWEDAGNVRGGKWIVRLRKGLASRYWEEMLLALIGGQFPGVPDGEINGAVVSIRYSEDIISVWNKRADDRDATDKIRDGIKKILRLPSHVHMEYKPHQTSLQDKSSFRNTTVWKPKGDRGMMGGDRGGPGGSSDHHHPMQRRERSGSGGASLSESRRTNSWSDRDKPKRDSDRSWR